MNGTGCASGSPSRRIDPKVSADQRGHGIGTALDVYTKTALNKKAEAAKTLENSVFAA